MVARTSALSTAPALVLVRASPASPDQVEINLGDRHLLRPAFEPVARSLFRLSPKPKREKRKGKAAAEEPTTAGEAVLEDGAGQTLDPATPTAAAWRAAAWLMLGGARLRVLFDPPVVESLSLPALPLVGVPMTPAVASRHCDAAACQFVWERRPPAAEEGGARADGAERPSEWQAVGRERVYVPSPSDLGALLRVRVEPPEPDGTPLGDGPWSPLLGAGASAEGAVEQPPARQLLGGRVGALGARVAAPSAIRVLTYNLMADSYSRYSLIIITELLIIIRYNLMADSYSRTWHEPGSVHSCHWRALLFC